MEFIGSQHKNLQMLKSSDVDEIAIKFIEKFDNLQ